MSQYISEATKNLRGNKEEHESLKNKIYGLSNSQKIT